MLDFTNTVTFDWPILDAEVLRIHVCIPEGLRAWIRSGSAPKEANPLGARVFWRTTAAKCDNDALHRLSHFAAPVHPEYPRPVQRYFRDRTLDGAVGVAGTRRVLS